ncbi:unnamed protein product [Rhodiola kirilowii]
MIHAQFLQCYSLWNASRSANISEVEKCVSLLEPNKAWSLKHVMRENNREADW